MTLKSPNKMKVDKMCRQPPTLTLIVPPERDYGMTLQQTKMVYDQLLADKHLKLYQGLMTRKAEYDNKCSELLATNKDTALEFGVRAQDALNKICEECSEEVMDQRRDYQEKLNKMYTQLEEKWQSEGQKRQLQAQNDPAVPCKVYPHK